MRHARRSSCDALMAKGSPLDWFDRGNQRAMDYQRSRPDAGLKSMPYAKSDSARRTAIAIIVVVGSIATIFGWRAGLVALVVAVPLLWRLEHHFFLFFLGRRGAEVSDSDDEPSAG